MRRMQGLVVAALLAAGLSVPADAAGAQRPQRVTFVLKRTTSGPTSFDLNVSVHSTRASGGGFIGSVFARVERGKPVAATGNWASSSARWDDSTVSVAGQRVTACQVGVCHDDRIQGTQGLGTTYSDDGEPDAATHFFVSAVGMKVGYQFRGKGWKLVRVPFGFRWLDGGETALAHAHAGTFGAEAFSDGKLAGGRHGSLAVGVPPCSLATVSAAARGIGTLTLEGGATKESVVCPGLPKLLGGYATKATTWRLHGTAVGESTNQDTRLFVVDLPARLP